MRIALIDDEKKALRLLKSTILLQIGNEARITTYPSGEEFLKSWSCGSFELIILDIFMEHLSGIEVARKIRETDRNVRLVFCSSSNSFASESYEINACYYLHKPFSEENIRRMLDRLELEKLELSRSVFLPDGQQVILRNILYTMYSGHSVTIYCKNGHTITARLPQSQIEDILCSYPYFFCCSKGVIVNFHEVASRKSDFFLMNGGEMIPVSRRKSKNVADAFADFRFEQLRKDGDS